MSKPVPMAQHPSPRKRPRGKRGTILVVAAAVALVTIPLAFQALPVEISRWYLADALAHLEASDYSAAQHSLEQAARFAPRDPTVHLIRAQALRGFDKLEASLAAAETALELAPESRQAHQQRAATLMEMQRFSEAATSLEAALEPYYQPQLSGGNDPLNSLAYARALAGENLPLALEEINRALDRLPSGDVMSRAAMLDTRAFVLYKQGNHKQALPDLDEAISLADLRRIRHLLDTLKQTRPGIEVDTILSQSRTNLAVMHYHRGLVHAALEQPERAAADFARVRELGHEPNEQLY